jgi:hypothetical protein
MSFAEVFAVFVVAHGVGDFLLQSEWQALHKIGGLGRDPVARRALVHHVTTYTLAFVPAVAWVAAEQGGAGWALLLAIGLPHLAQDDGRLLTAYVHRVKRSPADPGNPVFLGADQSLHLVALLGAALLAVA